MKTGIRGIAIALSAALVAATAIAPAASARPWHEQERHYPVQRYEVRHDHDHEDGAAWLGLGIAALAGAAIIANAAPQPEPVYAPPPAYAPAPTCTTINGYAACIGPDGNWQYVR